MVQFVNRHFPVTGRLSPHSMQTFFKLSPFALCNKQPTRNNRKFWKFSIVSNFLFYRLCWDTLYCISTMSCYICISVVRLPRLPGNAMVTIGNAHVLSSPGAYQVCCTELNHTAWWEWGHRCLWSSTLVITLRAATTNSIGQVSLLIYLDYNRDITADKHWSGKIFLT